MRKQIGLALSCLGAISCLLYFCSTPSNPYDNLDNVKVTYDFSSNNGSTSWNIDSPVTFGVHVLLIDKVDSLIISWADGSYDTVHVANLTSAQVSSGLFTVPQHHYTSPGNMDVTITTYAAGQTKRFQATITITCTAPTIDSTYHPTAAALGAPYSISVHATGSSLTYQWYKNDSSLANASHDSLTFASLAGSDAGFYYCIAKNLCGSDTSSYDTIRFSATLAVTYNGNGNTSGNVPTDPNSYSPNSSVTVLGNTGNLTRTGYNFAGWNTSANGSGTSYDVNATFTIGSSAVTLYAQWTTTPTYSVTYSGNGSTGGTVPVDPNTYKTSASVTVLGNTGTLVKSGSNLAGWNTAANGSGTAYNAGGTFAMGNATVILFAQWTTVPTFTVTYNGNGNTGGAVPTDATGYPTSSSVTVSGNSNNLTKTGNTFTGWNTVANGSGTAYASGATFTMGTANVTLYAQWTATPRYTVTYNGNGSTGGTVPTDTVGYTNGTTVTVLSNTGTLVRSGYTFAGWNTAANGSGSPYNGGTSLTMGTANVTLYAVWTTVPTYSVTYNGNGNTGGVVPVDPNNYPNTSSVSVLGNTGNLAKTGFTFAGWNTLANGSGTAYAGGATFTMGTANVTLFAQWTTIPTYSVTYNSNGSTSGTVPVDNNNYLGTASVTVMGNVGNLAKNGSTFSGWNTAANGSGTTYAAGGTFVMSSANVTLYAVWTVIPTFTVTYNGNGNTGGAVPVDAGSYTNGQSVTVLANSGNLARTGYTFAGWNAAANGSGAAYSGGVTFTMGTANVTLYALWTTVPTYTVTYSGNGNTSGAVPVDANNYANGSPVIVLGNTSGNLAKTGSTFAGWNTAFNGSGTTYSGGATFTMGTANVILYAQWTTNPTYTVSYSGNGNTSGNAPTDPNNYPANQTVTVLGNTGALGVAGSRFAGWNTAANGTGTAYSAGASFSIGSANVTLFAQWKHVFTVTYNVNGSTSGTVPIDANNYDSNVTVTVLSNTGALTKTGCTFAGWNTVAVGGGSQYAASGSATFTISANVTLYAQWTVNTCTITFNSNGGTPTTSTQTVNYNATVTSPTPTKTGFGLVGWYDQSLTTQYTFSSPVTSSFTLYAKWAALPDTGVIDAASMANDTEHTRTSVTLTGHITYLYPSTTNTSKWEWKIGSGGWQTSADGTVTFTTGASDTAVFACSLRVTNNYGAVRKAQKLLTIGRWEIVGNQGFSGGAVSNVGIVFCGQMPYVGFGMIASCCGDPASVMRLDTTIAPVTWGYAGYQNITNSNAGSFSLASDGSVPYFSCIDEGQLSAMKFNGTGWDNIGGGAYAPTTTSIAIFGTTPIIAYDDHWNSNKLRVVSSSGDLDGTTTGSSYSSASYICLAVANNVPYVAYLDGSGSAYLSRFNSSGPSWQGVGSGITAAGVNSLSLAFNTSYTPYVAYGDVTKSGKATVAAFNGTTWTLLGGAGFTTNQADCLKLAFVNTVPYVAYVDHSTNFVSVMKYDNTKLTWVNVGPTVANGANVSPGTATSVNIAVQNPASGAYVPYIVFSDNTQGGGKATVMRIR